MTERIFSDADITDLAKEVIKYVAKEAKLSPDVRLRELDTGIEFLLLSKETNTYICFSPQKRVEEILREDELDAIETLKGVVESESFNDAVRQQLWLSIYDTEIRHLIHNYPKEFKASLTRLEKAALKLSDGAVKAKENSLAELQRQVESVETLREFARKVDELHPLWEYVIRYFEEHGYDAECLTVIKDEQCLEIAHGIEIPKDLIKRVFKRNENPSSKRYRLEPLGFAIEHARRLISVTGEFDRLMQKYYEGKKFIGEEIIVTIKLK